MSDMVDLAARLCGFKPEPAKGGATVYRDLPAHEYHQMPELSASGCHTIYTRGLAAWKRERTQTRKSTDQMDMGIVVHSILFGDPDREVHVWSGVDRRSKGGKEEYADAVSIAVKERKTLIKQTAYAVAVNMADAVWENPIIGPILDEPGTGELSIVWPDESLGCDFRMRADWLPERMNAPIVDVKVVGELPESPEAWARKVIAFGYDVQEYLYRRGARQAGFGDRDFLFALVCSEPPHETAVFQLDTAWDGRGAYIVSLASAMLTQAQLSGEYPERYAGEVHTVPMPAWVRSGLEMAAGGSDSWL